MAWTQISSIHTNKKLNVMKQEKIWSCSRTRVHVQSTCSFILVRLNFLNIRKLSVWYHLFLKILKLLFLVLEKTKLFYTKESSSCSKCKFFMNSLVSCHKIYLQVLEICVLLRSLGWGKHYHVHLLWQINALVFWWLKKKELLELALQSSHIQPKYLWFAYSSLEGSYIVSQK